MTSPPPTSHTTTCGNICAPRGTGETRDDVNCGMTHGEKQGEARVTTASMNILIEENNNVLHVRVTLHHLGCHVIFHSGIILH